MKLYPIVASILSAVVLIGCGGKEENGGGGSPTTGSTSKKDPTIFNTSMAGSSFSPENQSTTITLKCDVAWTAQPENGVNWISVSPSSGSGNIDGEPVTVTIKMNTGMESRSGSVIFSAGSKTVKVTLNQKPITEMIKETEVVMTKTETYKLKIESKGTWKATLPDDADWLSFEPSSGSGAVTIYLRAKDENENVGDRTTKLRFTFGSDSYDLAIRQRQKNALLIDSDDFLISYDMQTVSVPVQTNIDFNVTIDEASSSWLHYNSTKALNSKTVNLTADANNANTPRTATVTFTNSDDISETLLVTQFPYHDILQQTDPGIYNLENENVVLSSVGWQLSMLKSQDGNLSLRMLNPKNVSIVSAGSVSSDVTWGSECAVRLVSMTAGKTILNSNLKGYVIKTTDSAIWVSLEDGTGIILKK